MLVNGCFQQKNTSRFSGMLVRFFVLKLELSRLWGLISNVLKSTSRLCDNIWLHSSNATNALRDLIGSFGCQRKSFKDCGQFLSSLTGTSCSRKTILKGCSNSTSLFVLISHFYSPVSDYLSDLNVFLGSLFRKIKIKLRNFLSFHNIISLRDLYAY
jgi:hypothetical protein